MESWEFTLVPAAGLLATAFVPVTMELLLALAEYSGRVGMVNVGLPAAVTVAEL